LPKPIRDAFLEDSLTDLIILELDQEPITSPAEGKKFVTTILPRYVDVSSALVASGAVERILVKLLMYSFGKPAPMDGMLAKLVKATKLSEKSVTPIVSLTHLEQGNRVTICVPEIDRKDQNSVRSLESYLTLVHYVLGVQVSNIFIIENKEYGTDLKFESVHLKLIEELTSSAALPSGAFAGDIISVGSYKCNLPGILASIHLLSRKWNFLRRRTPQKKEEIHPVTSSELRDIFNKRTGLADKTQSYPAKMIKSLLAVATSPKNGNFPGGWISSNRSINGVKTDIGVYFKLGYTERVPFAHKLTDVLFTDTSINPSARLQLRDKKKIEEFKELSFLEFRAGCLMTAPRLDVTSSETFESQMKKDPMVIRSPSVLDSFGKQKFFRSVDTLNRAHALKLSLDRKAPKTRVVHYQIARNEFLHTCARIPILDGQGNEFTKISDLPKPILDFCKNTFRYQMGTKRSIDESSMDVDSSAPDVGASNTSAVSSAPAERARKRVKSKTTPT